MSRHPAATIAKRNESVVQRLHTLKAEHPFWAIGASGPICDLWTELDTLVSLCVVA